VVAEARVWAVAAGRDVRFETSLPPEAVAFADRERLHQVLVNLLDNACGTARRTARCSHGRGRARTAAAPSRFATAGPGIPPADRKRGVRTVHPRRPRRPAAATGLGLAIAHWVVELHGGTIAVLDSAVGCRIRVTLPRSDGPLVTSWGDSCRLKLIL
jgi:signal transduction histidine kinase